MKKVGNYLLVSKLGEGQFGTVFKATHQQTKEIFAVKTIKKSSINSNPKLRTLFDTEMSVMSKIHHPNILHLHEYLETGNNYYLVLDFCNSGDIDNHVKKNDFLGEQESIYFLMQIMNGFKELHKHKIMHRDFKLANIFLNDDQVIIGDFGFAKSGYDMATTKLGSPITMAPEVLNAGQYARYTNKADLWSIGVCFYQMIFGKPPWDCKSIADLQNKVKTQSGSNLPIPNSPPTSIECKQLLKALIEPDPNRRIEWQHFFNHPIFSKSANNSPAPDMRQSVMFRNNEDRVQRLFNQNKQVTDNQEVVLEEDPRKIELDVNNLHQESNNNRDVERIVDQARQRYTHEKKIIVFMMHCCRRLRNLAKQRQYLGPAADGLMFVGLLLLKKGILLNQTAEGTLSSRRNSYGIPNFETFLSTPSASKIQAELSKDTKLYFTLIGHLQQKLQEEVNMSNPTAQNIYRLAQDGSAQLMAVQQELSQQSKYLIEYQAYKGAQLPPQINTELKTALAHLYLSVHHIYEFPFLVNTVPFDWRQFEADIRSSYKIDTVIRQPFK